MIRSKVIVIILRRASLVDLAQTSIRLPGAHERGYKLKPKQGSGQGHEQSQESLLHERISEEQKRICILANIIVIS